MMITDEMLYQYAEEARDIWLGILPKDGEIPEHKFSKKFERKMQKLLKEQRRTREVNLLLQRVKRSVAIVAIVIMVAFGGMMTVEAYREKVIEVVVYVFNELTDYRFSSISPNGESVELPEISFQYIPDGMIEVENRVTDGVRRRVLYENPVGEFFQMTQRVITSDGDHRSILDTEDAETHTIMLNGVEAVVNTKDDASSVYWTNQHVLYQLFGNIELSELLIIVENLKIN